MSTARTLIPPRATAAIIEVVGAPVDHGGAGAGAAGGPRRLREAGIGTIDGRTVRDRGDVAVPDLPAGVRIVPQASSSLRRQ